MSETGAGASPAHLSPQRCPQQGLNAGSGICDRKVKLLKELGLPSLKEETGFISCSTHLW